VVYIERQTEINFFRLVTEPFIKILKTFIQLQANLTQKVDKLEQFRNPESQLNLSQKV
jgi:hypothetical protein